jgi:hypothetical protein
MLPIWRAAHIVVEHSVELAVTQLGLLAWNLGKYAVQRIMYALWQGYSGGSSFGCRSFRANFGGKLQSSNNNKALLNGDVEFRMYFVVVMLL